MAHRVLQSVSCARFILVSLAFSAVLPLPAMAGGPGIDHPLLASRADARRAAPGTQTFPDTVRALAAMVQFQLDDDPRTTGNGQFDLSAPPDSILDAPPRDRRYFEDHLTFVRNYYRRVSEGKVVVEFTVIETVITLPERMERYSPPKDGSFAEVADLARDTWGAVDAAGVVPDFTPYEVFVVFHAGVGRDIDLVGTLGFDPTPFDIPSLYLGLRAFQEVYGPGFDGIPVQGGAVRLTNSMVIPETESRTLPGVVGDVLLELSINGLLCASFGNYLGLPDLFDTSTGRSGIGRFGLMDGQAIFSYSGLFPPEPSAWEKSWLGWVTPVELPVGTSQITLPAASLTDTIYRIPISTDEYYLIENRNRDALGDGQRITSVFNGVARDQTFRRDTAGFNAFDISALAGVITDVDEPDWSIPGVTDPDGEFFDGGVLIWHIDEGVIAQTLQSNSINADPSRRGVDVEEADGSQDIGQQYDFLSPGSGSEEGTPLDFWYQNNSAPVYRNEFSAGTFPPATSNGGAATQVTVRDFSPRAPTMTAIIVRGGEDVRPVAGFPRSLMSELLSEAATVSALQAGGEPVLVVGTTPRPNSGSLPEGAFFEAWNLRGEPALPVNDPTHPERIVRTDGSFGGGAALGDLNGDGVIELVVAESPRGSEGRVRAISLTTPGPGEILPPDLFSTPLAREFATSALIGAGFLAVADTADSVYVFNFDGTLRRSVALPLGGGERLQGLGLHARGILATGSLGTVALLDPAADPAFTAQVTLPGALVGGTATAGSGSGPVRTALATAGGELFLLDESLRSLPGFPVRTNEPVLHGPVVADLDGDGLRDLILATEQRLWAVNEVGVALDNFPVTLDDPIASSPVVGDVNGDGLLEAVVATRNGVVVAYGASGASPAGFPLQTGTHPTGVAIVSAGDSLFLAVTTRGGVSLWRTGTQRRSIQPGVDWPQFQFNAARSALVVSPLQGAPLSGEFFPASRAYNWPNPVYDGTTYFRYFVSEDAEVAISIFDLAGDLVAELAGRAIGGLDNEIAWSTADVQSGVYLARIEASGAGRSGVAIVKVAVVR